MRKYKNVVTCTPPRNNTPELPGPPRETETGERDRGPDLEAAGRGSSSREPQGELQGDAPAQGEAGRVGWTGEEEIDS